MGMKTGFGISAVAVAVSLGWASPALAGAKEDAAMREELAAMRAQMAKASALLRCIGAVSAADTAFGAAEGFS